MSVEGRLRTLPSQALTSLILTGAPSFLVLRGFSELGGGGAGCYGIPSNSPSMALTGSFDISVMVVCDLLSSLVHSRGYLFG